MTRTRLAPAPGQRRCDRLGGLPHLRDANPELQNADDLLSDDWVGRAILIPQRKG
ncbi:hypothetical protein [Marinobacterium rhizophilum]|uniref:hypothetical protein n=1 Tax=Marinobacterium rhizophilum TaxID=420402 RepID=UPI0012EB50D2|nr:hypothetical protein [Marinobacterium rhizophilum]